MKNTIKNDIKWSVDHDCEMDKAYLVGTYNGTTFVETINLNSRFSFGLIFAKWKITRRFKIIFNEQHNEN